MRIPGRTVLAACSLALTAGMLAACTSPDASADPTTTAKPSPTPVFTSDAEALAAATATFKKYESASDAVGHGGWANPDLVRPYVSDAGYKHELQAAKKYRAQHAKAVGSTIINNTAIESHQEGVDGATIRIYVCEDLSDVDVQDGSGMSLIDPSRSDLVAFVAELEGTSAASLVIQSLDYWSGGGVCKD